MNDINCPYCNAELEIDHDEGYGYEEDQIYEQECVECHKYFVYSTSISYYYDAEKADCLNGSEHDWKQTTTYPKEFTKMRCSMCDAERTLTSNEKEAILNAD